MDVTHLGRFVAVATHGSLSAAARALRLSQPTVTWSVQQLEREIGTRLLERTAGGVATTSAGAVLLERARRILGELERAKSDVAAAAEKRNQQLVVASTPPVLSAIATPVIAKMLGAMPGLQVRLVQLDTLTLASALKDSAIDVGFWNPAVAVDLRDFDFESTFSETYVVAARREHPVFRSRKPMTLATALEYDWVMHEFAYRHSAWDATGTGSGVPRPNVRVEVNSEHVVRGFVLESDLLGYVAQDMIQRDLDEGTIRLLPIPELTIRTRAGLLVRKGAVYTPAMKMFCREIRLACRRTRRR